jgi:hypothetical protein
MGNIRSRKSKTDRHFIGQMKKGQGQNLILKTLHRKRKFEQREPHLKPRMNWSGPEG